MQSLYSLISAIFCTIVVVSNIISAKMTPLPFFDLSIPTGLVTYPLTFLLSDLVTEFYGTKLAKRMVYTAFGMSLLSFAMIQLAVLLPGTSQTDAEAFQTVLGLSGLRIFSSLAAYTIAQITSVYVYALIKKWTRDRFLWMRNNGATCLSQIIDTVAVDLIFLYWGLKMDMQVVLPIMLFSYAYKALFSIASTPLFYAAVFLVRKSGKNIPSYTPIKNTP